MRDHGQVHLVGMRVRAWTVISDALFRHFRVKMIVAGFGCWRVYTSRPQETSAEPAGNHPRKLEVPLSRLPIPSRLMVSTILYKPLVEEQP